ncbi:conserved hypothetical protein [Leptospira interrogans serovar Manilae]|uniref:Uncharacterized protein n=1 Tax=Leptospira interrogans serovar Manilae TaxID=214675 RepID=A0AAQ1P134_LEPIR|nr:conserved hypothetical protein [Leptospira interrogans serovar Manilae]
MISDFFKLLRITLLVFLFRKEYISVRTTDPIKLSSINFNYKVLFQNKILSIVL